MRNRSDTPMFPSDVALEDSSDPYATTREFFTSKPMDPVEASLRAKARGHSSATIRYMAERYGALAGLEKDEQGRYWISDHDPLDDFPKAWFAAFGHSVLSPANPNILRELADVIARIRGRHGPIEIGSIIHTSVGKSAGGRYYFSVSDYGGYEIVKFKSNIRYKSRETELNEAYYERKRREAATNSR